MPVLRQAPIWFVVTLVMATLVAACSGPDSSGRTITTPNAEPTTTRGAATATVVEPRATATLKPTASTGTPQASATAAATAAAPSTATGAAVTLAPTSTATPAGPPSSPTAATPVNLGQLGLAVEPVGKGFTQPLFVTGAGDGSGRVFVLEKVGAIRLLDGTLFLDIRDRVISTPVNSYEREQGLLGLAFHPRFAENGFFYVHYNNLQGDHVISRFSLGADGLGDPASEKVLLTQEQPEVNFNGGMLAFGPDGYLYIGLGTGGTAVELQYNAQSLGSLLGKILRIDVDNGDPYAIPPDNPFVNRPDARPEVWAWGLRNPYRFAFDRATGDMYIGGPGQFTRESIYFQPAGQGGINFSWPMYEGTVCWESWTGPCDPAGMSLPIVEYVTYAAGNCVVIGGNVYRGARYPALQGAYLFGDFCSGRIWATARDAAGNWQPMTELAQLPGVLLSSFGEDESGELYVTDIQNGTVYRIVAPEG